MEPLHQGAASFPAAALRADLGMGLVGLLFGPSLLKTGLLASTLTGPFSKLVDQHVSDPWLRKWLDLECYVLSGMLAEDTICAEMAFMFQERHSSTTSIDYPLGGGGAIVDALIRGIEKNGGNIMLSTHVDRIVGDGVGGGSSGRATGVVATERRGTSKERTVTVRARRLWSPICPSGTTPSFSTRRGSFLNPSWRPSCRRRPAGRSCTCTLASTRPGSRMT